MLECVESVDLLSDQALQRRLVRDSGGVFLAGMAASAAWALSGLPLGRWGEEPVALLVVVALASVAVLPVHELIHALLFKLLGRGPVRLRFGYKDGMLYCGAPGTLLGRRQMVVVTLAPAVVLTLLFALAGWWLDAPFAAFLCTWIHLSGCSGDALLAEAILQNPDASVVRDTATGADLLREVPDAQ